MRKLSKTLLSLLLIAAMLASFVVLPAAAEEPAAEQPTEAVQAAETQADDAVKTNYELSIVMLDCGRKYFSVDSIKQIIDNASAAGFGYIMLGVGNDGMRFLLDDMSLTVRTARPTRVMPSSRRSTRATRPIITSLSTS